MRFNLWHNKVKVGEGITDKPLVKGDLVQTGWSVVGEGTPPAWGQLGAVMEVGCGSGNRSELTSVKTSAATKATKRIRALTPTSELRAWGLWMQARHGGLAVQRLYRMRGITDPCEKAREVRSRNCAARRRAKDRKQDHVRLGPPEPNRRKVLASGW